MKKIWALWATTFKIQCIESTYLEQILSLYRYQTIKKDNIKDFAGLDSARRPYIVSPGQEPILPKSIIGQFQNLIANLKSV